MVHYARNLFHYRPLIHAQAEIDKFDWEKNPVLLGSGNLAAGKRPT
jgi:hypothetical protein